MIWSITSLSLVPSHWRREVREYLELSPENAQVAQLRDVMDSLINIDGEVSEEEELMSVELIGLIDGYLKDDEQSAYFVAILPNDPEQAAVISSLLPNTEKKRLSSGEVYVNGPFYSKNYSSVVSKKYHSLNCHAFVVDGDQVLAA